MTVNTERFIKTAPENSSVPKVKNWLAKYWQLVALAGVLGLTLFLHLYDLKDGKGADEVLSYFSSVYPPKEIIPHLWPDHSPLFFFVSHYVLKLIDDTHDMDVLRLPWALVSLLLIPLIYRLAREITGNKAVALTVALLTAFEPSLLQLSREFRMYGLMLLFSMLSMLFALRALRYNKIWDWAGFVIFCELNIYNHFNGLLATFDLGLFGVIWLALNFAAALNKGPRFEKFKKLFELNLRQTLWRLLGLGLSASIIFVLYLPWFPHFLNLLHAPNFGPNITWLKPSNTDNFYKYVSNSGFGYDIGFWITLPLSLLGLGWLLWKRFSYGLFCLCYFWLMFLVLANLPGHDNFFDIRRYYCFVAPVFLIMLGEGIGACVWLVQRWGKFQVLKFALPVLILGFLIYQSVVTTIAFETYKPQASSLYDIADFLNANLQPNDTVLLGAIPEDNTIFKRNYFIGDNFAYYMTPNAARADAIRPQFLEIENLIALPYLQKLQANHANIWLLTVLEGSDADKAKQLQQIKNNENEFDSHCFEDSCFIEVKPAFRLNNQYDNLELMLSKFSFMNPAFGQEATELAQLNLGNLQPVTSVNPAEFYLSGQPVYLPQPASADSQPQYYCIKFQYRGTPSRLFIGVQDKNNANTSIVPSWEGYAPPTANDWTQTGLIFQATPGTARSILTAFAENEPAVIKDVQLWKIGVNSH